MMHQFKYRSNHIAFILLLLVLLLPGCTINIYFINPEPAPVEEGQSSITGGTPDLPLVNTPQDEQVSIAPSSAASSNTTEKKYVGSINSNKYHLPDCEWAQKISPSNQVWFSSAEEAMSKGYLPCKVCQPH